MWGGGNSHGRRLFGMDRIIRRLSQTLATTVLGYITGADKQGLDQEVETSTAQDETTVLLLQSKLDGLYRTGAVTAVNQAQVVLSQYYHGNLKNFLSEFLHPVVLLLHGVKESQVDVSLCERHKNWPITYRGCVLIHLCDPGTQHLLHPGDFYFIVEQNLSGQYQLVLRYLTNEGVFKEVLANDKGFTMDRLKKLKSCSSNEDLGHLLQRCLLSFEESLQRLKLEDVSPDSCINCQINRQQNGTLQNRTTQNRSVQNGSLQRLVPKPRQFHRFSQASTSEGIPGGASSAHRRGSEGGQPSSPRSPGFYNHRMLDMPQTIMDVNYELLQSGIAILPGCRDQEGCPVVFIFTSSSLWQHQKVSSIELARILLYYRSVPREEVKVKGLKIVADIRGASTSTMNTLLETLYLFQGNCPGAVSTVYMITDEISQALVTRSPLYDPMATFRMEMLSTVDHLKRILSMDQLPVALDGYYTYNHEDWMRFHMKLDPFVSKLRSVAKYLVCVMQDLSDVESMPGTARETSLLIEHHEQLIKSVFEDQRVASIQTDGEGIINTLKREELHMGHSVDYRESMDSVNNLYDHLQTTMVKLVRLSDSRLSKLEQCLQLQEFEEECTKVIVWVQGHGEDALKRHTQLADNLKAIRSQQKDFEKFHFTAMTHIEKGNDLLEEASMLAQSGNFDEVTGYKELARTLKKHLQDFTARLEDTRERIESTTKCYHLLDKTYEWALDAMKYVASMKMEHCATADGLDKLLRSLELYLRDHPVMKEETFVSMLDLAQKLRNEKLVEQSRVAKARCEETHKLLCLRQSTMQQAKEKMLLEIKTVPQSPRDKRQNDLSLSPVEVKNLSHSPKDPSRGSCDKIWSVGSPVIGSPIIGSPSSLRSGIDTNISQDSVWRPQSSSTPSVSERPLVGYASSGSSVSSPISVFDNSQPFLEHGESIITEDMSNRIVTSIPKLLSDTTLRSSREDLTSPIDISVSSTDSSAATLSKASSDASGPASAFSSHNRPCKKVLKRTSTAPPVMTGQVIQEENEGHMNRTDPLSKRPQRHDGRTVSMITSSTDSLTSLPEEIEDPETSSKTSSSPPKEFSPVPVNTHLSSQYRNIPTGSLADLKLTGTEKTKRTLAHVMREMVQTERDYVCALQYIIHNYVPELQRDDVPQALRGKRNVIFGNLEKIYQFHRQYFLREVEMCENNPFQIAHYFLMHGSQFYLYALYNKNKPKSDSLMAEYGKYFFREKQSHLGDKMDLSSYLLKPVQRMGKYALLLKQIMKACPHSEQEYQDLKAAEEMVKFQLRHGNDLLAMDSLKDCDVNLQEQGRLLRQDEFLVWQGRKKSMRHVFLFEDMILFSKTRRGRNGSPDTYNYKFSFKMADVGLTESYGESGYKFEIWFRRRNLGENYILQAQGSEIKHAWVKEISRILWKQALKNRDNHLTEMATMGVGNKPCLDIKPSANNIQDRYINFAVSERGARTRNSIAVTSFEHLRQGNKRPHSIISVSSTSSSSSSHSGLGPPMFAALPPGFESADTPRCRQSIACMSNESGIGTDISSNEPDKNGTLEKLRFHTGGAVHARNYSEYEKPKLILSSPAFTDTVSTDV